MVGDGIKLGKLDYLHGWDWVQSLRIELGQITVFLQFPKEMNH